MAVRRGGISAHRLIALCALMLLLASAIAGGTRSASAQTDPTGPPGVSVTAQASSGDESPACSGDTQEPVPLVVPRQHQDPGQPAASPVLAPDTIGVPPAGPGNPPARGPGTRPPDLAQLSVLRI
ncbi:hypothetical protein [Streptomyces gobiensis]|uniref:hypothetical protein n=1 Tax=Streptomyces gobiensis TaxID=2875706 RepID=UPI001E57BC96|nr:hypothetical protein [Streptomyces gobiensis]UGY91971.1 hypothetical protein test1122_09725 [Streptomyces gobiensis]